MAYSFKWLPITYIILEHSRAIAWSSYFLYFPCPLSTPADIFMPDLLWLCQVAYCWGQICFWGCNLMQRYNRAQFTLGSVQVWAILLTFLNTRAPFCFRVFTHCSVHFFPVVLQWVPYHTNSSFFSSSQLSALRYKVDFTEFSILVVTNMRILKVD